MPIFGLSVKYVSNNIMLKINNSKHEYLLDNELS